MSQALAVKNPFIGAGIPFGRNSAGQAASRQFALPHISKKLLLACSVKLIPAVGVFALSVALMLTMIRFQDALASIGPLGYLTVFLAELINSAVVIVPTPSHTYTMAMALVLNPYILGVVGGIGAAIGEMTAYFIGSRSRTVIPQGRLFERVQSLVRGKVGLVVFALAVLPLPFDVVGMWAGMVRYSVSRFFLFMVVGKIIKVTVTTVAAFYGFQLLLNPMSQLGSYF